MYIKKDIVLLHFILLYFTIILYVLILIAALSQTNEEHLCFNQLLSIKHLFSQGKIWKCLLLMFIHKTFICI